MTQTRVVLLLVAVGIIVAIVWRDYQRDPVKLAGTPWVCIKPVTAPRTEWLYVGKTAIPITTFVDECAKWGQR